MLIIPGALIAIVTFPGVIVHELAHQWFCRLMRVPVYEVKYFQAKRPNGYVMHESSDRPLANFLICVGPFLVNTLIGAVMLVPGAMLVTEFGGVDFSSGWQAILLGISLWFGISILMHAFPSTGDAKVLVSNILKNKDVPLILRVLVAPVIGLIYLGALGSFFWLDLVYAIAIVFLLPKALIAIL